MGPSDRPEVLTYRFHNFRPSDRDILRQAARAPGGVEVYLAALRLYLEKWARADWLTEYDLERIAIWTAAHLPHLSGDVERMAQREFDAAQTEQAKKTYATMARAIRKEAAAGVGGTPGLGAQPG